MSKKAFVLASSLVLSLGALRADSPAPTVADKLPRDFYFGVEFRAESPEPVRQLFFETGMNWVRLTGGGYAWSLEPDKKLADDFATRGLKVCLQLGSHYPPGDYLDMKDAYMVDQDGKTGVADKKLWAVTYSGLAWPQYSYTDPEFRSRLTRDFTKWMARFNDNRNIAGVILHNEAGYFWLSDRVFDYNPTTIAAFKKWLEEQHGTIAKLNERWGTNYASFADVVPPGKPPVTNLAAWMDWRRFSVSVVEGFLKWEADFFRAIRPDVPPSTNLDGPLNNWYGYRCANMQAYSAAMDRVGIDIYPSIYTTRDFVPYCTDMVQGIAQGREGNVFECESFSQAEWKDYDEETRAGLLRSEVWTMVGHGITGILLWGFDTFSNDDGAFNARILATRDIAHQAKMIGVKDFHREKSRVAIAVDPDSYLHDTGIETSQNQYTTSLDHECGGFHAALADAGYQTDVIFVSQIPQDVLKNYQVVVLPSAMMMDEDIAKRLKDFVSNGGTLIATEPFSLMDRWTKPLATVPGYGLDEVFGATVDLTGDADGYISTARGTLATITSKAKLTAKGAQDIGHMSALAIGNLTVHGAQVIGTFPDKSPAITQNSYGKGTAILIARKVGLPYLDFKDSSDALSAFLGDVLQQVSIQPVAKQLEGGGTLDVSYLTDTHGNALIIPSIPTASGKSLPGIKDAKIVYHCDDAAAFHAGFAFPATTTADGIVRSGPVPLTLTPASDNKSLSFSLPKIDTVMPVLLVKDGGPFLSVEMPATVTAGQETPITVTCFCPSSSHFTGTIGVRAGGEVSVSTDKGVVDLQPFLGEGIGQVTTRYILKAKITAPGDVARVPVTVFLTPEQGPEITAIPVDIAVKK